MTTQVLIKKLNKEVTMLKEEIREMKSFIFAPMEDPEGKYKASFIKKIRARAKSPGPFYQFTDKESFLKHVRSTR